MSLLYEKGFVLLGALLSLLCLHSGENLFFSLLLTGSTILYTSILFFFLRGKTTSKWQKIRVATCFAYAFFIYNSVKLIANTLMVAEKDSILLRIDVFLFGKTPALLTEAWITSFWTDVYSVFYITYIFYLFISFLYSLTQSTEKSQMFAHYFLVSYLFGIIFYITIPAIGPRYAFPELFSVPLSGGTITYYVEWWVSRAPGYDVFPSLHTMITLVLLDYDFKYHRRRFTCMLIPGICIIISTIYLRYHYAIDLIAGLFGFLLVRSWLWYIYNRSSDSE